MITADYASQAGPLPRLCGAIAPLLGGPGSGAGHIDDGLVRLARRHQVGPLLHAAIAANGDAITPAGASALARDYQESLARRASALARLDRIGRVFAARGIAWMAIKGTTQAAMLYPDPACRFSSDLDLLVAPKDFAPALAALEATGFVASYPPIPQKPLARAASLALLRDVTLIAGDDHSCAVELHSRLFFAGGPANALAFPRAPGPIPMPDLGQELAFYLVLHGALSYWVRLKWLVDLVPVFAKLDDAGRLAIRGLARKARAESAVAASLLLLREYFSFAALGPLIPWLDEAAIRPAVIRRYCRYRRMLTRDDDQRHTPINDAWASLEANLMAFEDPAARARLLLGAPASSAVRRIAGRLYPAQRSLTLPPPASARLPAIQRDTP